MTRASTEILKHTFVSNSKRVIFFFGVLSLIACEASKSLDGLWVSESNQVIFIKNDSVMSARNLPIKLEVINPLLGETSFLISPHQPPAVFNGDAIVWFDEKHVKSPYNNLFDHHNKPLGINIELELINDYSDAPRKQFYTELSIALSEDKNIEIYLDEEKASLATLPHTICEMYNENSTCFIQLAVDKNLTFQQYKKVHEAITKGERPVKIYHAKKYTASSFAPGETVAYEFIHSSYSNSTHRLPNSVFTFSINNQNQILLNAEVIKREELYSTVLPLYINQAQESLFIIQQTESLTYGQYLWITATLKAVSRACREKYKSENFQPSNNFEEINSMNQVARSLFPMNIVIDTNLNILNTPKMQY